MTPAWAQRQEELLGDCIVSPDVFQHMVDRLGDFVVPYQHALETEASGRHVHLYLQGLLSHLERKNAETVASFVDVERQVIQDFIGTASWDHRPLITVLVSQVAERLGEPDGMGVSHLLHTRRPGHLRTFLYKLGTVEGEGLNCLIDLNIVLPGCCRPEPVVLSLQSAEQPHPRLGVGPTPVLPHPLVPQIPQSLLPVVVKEGEHLLEMSIVHCVDLLAQLFQFDLRLGFAVRMVEDIDQLPENTAEAVDKTLIVSFQRGNRLLFLRRHIGGFLQEYPTPLP